jgi:hypothetical protein
MPLSWRNFLSGWQIGHCTRRCQFGIAPFRSRRVPGKCFVSPISPFELSLLRVFVIPLGEIAKGR